MSNLEIFINQLVTKVYQSKFVVTTVKARRDETLHPKDLAGRGATVTSVCPSTAQLEACSCMVTCPATVTKDKRKTIQQKTTETSYSVSLCISDCVLIFNCFKVFTTTIPSTETAWNPILFTNTAFIVETKTEIIVPTNTRTVKCTPSVINSSFYLKATNAPAVNDYFIQVYPNPWANGIWPSHKRPVFTPNRDIATVFSLDSKNRLITVTKDHGTVYGFADDFNDFQLFHWLERSQIQSNPTLFYADCIMNEPSGNFTGGYKELTCQTHGWWNNRIFQFCPVYIEFFDDGLVLGAKRSPDSPSCQDIVLQVVPVCG
jgi:hypothetical protein